MSTTTTTTTTTVKEIKALIDSKEISITAKVKQLESLIIASSTGKQLRDKFLRNLDYKLKQYKAKKDCTPVYHRSWERRIEDFSLVDFATKEEKQTLQEAIKLASSGLSSKIPASKYAQVLRDKYTTIKFLRSRNFYTFDPTKNRSVPICDLSKDSLYSEIPGYFVHCKETVTNDWDYYSKAWHSAHGPKKTVESRQVIFTSKKTLKVVYTHNLDSWKGNYILEAVASFLKIDHSVKVAKEYRKVQLDQRLNIDLIKDFNGVQIWKRSLGNIIWDYCIVSRGETFHASTPKMAIDGLRKKRSTRVEKDQETIDYNKVLDLGFCDTGIRSFCRDNNLDIDLSYTIKALRGIVVQNRQLNADRYGKDLRKIGIILNSK